MNLECLNVLHKITVEPHPVPTIIAYTGSYLNLLMRRQIVRISGTISLQVKIPVSGFSVNETIPLNQSQYSFLLNNIHIPCLWTSSSRNLTFVLIILHVYWLLVHGVSHFWYCSICTHGSSQVEATLSTSWENCDHLSTWLSNFTKVSNRTARRATVADRYILFSCGAPFVSMHWPECEVKCYKLNLKQT